MKKLSLRTEFVLWSGVILLIYMIIQTFFTSFYAHTYATRKKEVAISQTMTTLMDNYSDSPFEIYKLVEDAQVVDNLRIMVFSQDSLIYHSSSLGKIPDQSNFTLPMGMDETEKAPLEVQVLEIWDMVERRSSTFNEEFFSLLTELEHNVVGAEETFLYQGESRTIVIWSSILAIDDTVKLFYDLSFRVSAVVMLLIIMGVIFLSRRIIRPISQVEQVASAVADLDFSKSASEEFHSRELSSLSKSINVMSGNLEEMFEKLQADKETLKDKVENQEKLDQMRRQFVANISHEMKTPLSLLMMYCENLKLDLPNMDKNFYYDTIIQESAGLNAMVEQLLDTSSVENGLSKLSLEPLDFSKFIELQVEKITPLLEEYQFSAEIFPDILVNGDRKYLEHAVGNYFSNAIAHTEKGKKISLKLWAEEEVYFQLANEGKPIPAEDLPYVWDSFYRGDKSRTQVGEKRVGLGLYIVKTCISSHFGEVAVENGEETVVFSFRLPKLPPNSL